MLIKTRVAFQQLGTETQIQISPEWPLPPPRIIYNNFSGQYNILAFVSSQPNYQPNMLLLTQKQAIFAFAVSALLNILQLNADSPFHTHPKVMGIAILSFLAYCIACHAELRISSAPPISPNYNANVIHRAVTFLGYLSLASLASLLVFPISFRPIGYLVLALVSVWLLPWVRTRILFGRGYTHNSQSPSGRIDVPSIHHSVDIDTLQVKIEGMESIWGRIKGTFWLIEILVTVFVFIFVFINHQLMRN